MERQAAGAIDEADALILVVDGQVGCNPLDEEIVAWLRRVHPSKPVTLAVNKVCAMDAGGCQENV